MDRVRDSAIILRHLAVVFVPVIFVVTLVVPSGCRALPPAQLAEARSELASIAGPPGGALVSQGEIVKYTTATLSRYYRAEVGGGDVRAFYDREMTGRGWRLIRDRKILDWDRDFGGFELVFRRDDLTAHITYAGESRPYEWDVAVTVHVGGGAY